MEVHFKKETLFEKFKLSSSLSKGEIMKLFQTRSELRKELPVYIQTINSDSKLFVEELYSTYIDNDFYTVEKYLQDRKWKAREGESCEKATKRATFFLQKILKQNMGKRIVLVSHGALISFLLTNWCTLNKDTKLVFNDKVIEIKEPSITKLTFDNQKLLNIESIEIYV